MVYNTLNNDLELVFFEDGIMDKQIRTNLNFCGMSGATRENDSITFQGYLNELQLEEELPTMHVYHADGVDLLILELSIREVCGLRFRAILREILNLNGRFFFEDWRELLDNKTLTEQGIPNTGDTKLYHESYPGIPKHRIVLKMEELNIEVENKTLD